MNKPLEVHSYIFGVAHAKIAQKSRFLALYGFCRGDGLFSEIDAAKGNIVSPYMIYSESYGAVVFIDH